MDFDGIAREAVQAAMSQLGVGDIGTFTVATLPDPAAFPRRTIWCADLHEGAGGRLVSESGFWKPIRPLAMGTQGNSNQNLTLIPLSHSPTQIMPTTLTANRTISFSTTNAYPGQRFRIKRTGGGLFNLITSVASLGANSWADFEFDPVGNAFVQTASGGLL
jgi:hypothetical protein